MASRRRSYSPWQSAQPFLVVAGIVVLVGLWFGFPGPAIYIFAFVLAKKWPREEEYEPETPKAEKARKAKVYAHHLLSPFGTGPFAAKLLAGPPGQYSQQAGSYLPATRISTWAAVPLVWLSLGLFAALPTAIPLVDAFFVFLLWQAAAAGARESAHPAEGEAFPAAMLERDVLARTNVTVTAVSAAVGFIIGGATGWFLAGRIDALVSATTWPTWMKAATAALMGAAAALGAASRPYIDAYLEPVRDHLAKSEAWQMRWLSIPKLGVAPPMFASEHVQPPEGAQLRDGSPAEETHRVAYFQTPPGATIENYRAKTDVLTSAIAASPGEAEYVLVAPMNKLNEMNQPIPGTRQEAYFGVYWNTVPLPDQAHLVTGLDNWTTKFVIQRAFDRAFVSLKLGMPDLVRVLPLHDMNTPQALWETIWVLPPETTFEKVISKERDIAEKIGADFVTVGRHTKDSSGGRIHETHVSVVFGTHPDHVELADPNLSSWLDSLQLESAFHNLRLGNPLLEDTEQLSMPGHPTLMEARFKLDSKVSWGDVIRKTDALAEKLNVDYLRVTRRLVGSKSSPIVSIIYGTHPSQTVLIGDPPDFDPDEIREGEETSQLRLFLAGVDWDAWFRSCKLVGSDGSSPKPVTKHVNSQGVATYRMISVPGLATEDIREKTDAIMNTSGLGYVEVEDDPDASYFRLLAAKIDPLDKDYLAVEYAPEPKPKHTLPVLHDPVPGKPDIDWVVGPGADGQLLVDRWAGDNPHLFVGGASGSGKSVAILWMILQMLHNNDPRDVKFALADPKTELGYFADAEHTNFFLGLTTPGFGENPRRALADLLEHMRDETYRRNTLMANHPRMPQNLNQSRFIAAQEIEHARQGTVPEGWPTGLGFPWWDGGPDEHPFMLPFQFIVIEECSSFFATPAKKDHREDWEAVIGHVEELARISRSAGIHLIAATQYPKKENIPTTLLAQCRRIGLPMNRVGSMLTIEEPGLDKLTTPGRGMMSQGKGYRGVRCLFVRVPDDKNPDIPDDRAAIYSKVVRKEGARQINPDADVPPDPAVSHGPTFVSAPPPSADGLWVPRGQSSSAAAAASPPADNGHAHDLLAELEQAVTEAADTPVPEALPEVAPEPAMAAPTDPAPEFTPDTTDVIAPPAEEAGAAPDEPGPPSWALEGALTGAPEGTSDPFAPSEPKTTEGGYRPNPNTLRGDSDRNGQDKPAEASPPEDTDLDDLLAGLD